MIELASLDFGALLTVQGIIALLTLTALEIVLGIDNIIFISIISNSLSLPQEQRKARQLGLALAMITRILLLLSLTWIMSLNEPFTSVLGHELSGRDVVLLAGGLFLLFKATMEIHHNVQGDEEDQTMPVRKRKLWGVIAQILVVDVVFSLDSVITAVGMSDQLVIMILAVMIAVLVMMVSAGPISSFVERQPTVKMLALSFLVMIGVSLLVEGMGGHLNKNYIYFAMGFSVLVETLNLRMAKRRKHARIKAEEEALGQ